MKKQYIGIVVVALLALFSNTAKGQQSMSFGWTPPTDPAIAGYTLHFGNASQNYTLAVDAGTNNTITVSNIALNANLFFAVTSHDANGNESMPSTEVYLSPTMTDFMIGHISFTNGINYLAFTDGNIFGYYGWVGFPWFYHIDMGYEYLYDAQDGQGSVYLWDYASGSWWYTNPQIFPIMYDFTLNDWIYYYPDATSPGRYTANPREFYNFTTKQRFNK